MLDSGINYIGDIIDDWDDSDIFVQENHNINLIVWFININLIVWFIFESIANDIYDRIQHGRD